jgi:predicted glutamine amidotransferase
MCGIVYYKSFNHSRVNKRILKQYKKQAHRGQQGFGFYLPQTNRLTHHPAEDRIQALLKRVKDSEVLFHHRFPTSTANVKNACHPFSTKDFFGNRQFVMVHNGWLTNDYDLEAAHDKLGIKYVSLQPDGKFNDSEALLYDLALVVTGQQEEPKARGAVAFVMIERLDDEPVKLHFGRNTSPLNMQVTEGGMGLSSEGAGEAIERDMLYTYDYATGKLTQSPMKIQTYQAYTYSPKEYVYKNPHYSDEDYNFVYPSQKASSGASSPTPAPALTASEVVEGEVLSKRYGEVRLDDGSDSFDTAGELLAVEGGYTEAIRVAEGRKRRAEHKLVTLSEDMEEVADAGGASGNLDEQMEQIMLAEHYAEVVDLLKDWLLEDKTLPKRATNARKAHV